MALLPLFHDLLDDFKQPVDLYDQHFGLGLLSDIDLIPTSVLLSPLRSGYIRPWRTLTAADSGVSSVLNDKNEFRINLDVQEFKPEDLKVKVADGYVVIDGKHEEKSDKHGFVSRQFTRKYMLPKDVDEGSLTSSVSSDGVLVLKAAKKALPESKGKDIPITLTNEPAIKDKKQEGKMEQ